MKADKKIITLFIIIALALLLLNIASFSYAGDEMLKKALDKYEIHHYKEAIELLKKEIASKKSDELILPYFILGRIYLKEAELYRAIYETSLITTKEYLVKLDNIKSAKKSRYLPYFLGVLHLELGEYKKAAKYLHQYINSSNADEEFREIAKIKLGAAYYKLGAKKKAMEYWKQFTANDANVVGENGYIFASLNIRLKDAVEMSQNAINLLQKSGKKGHSQLYKNIAFVYYKNDMVDAAIELLDKQQVGEPLIIERVEKNKVVKFYDPAIAGDMAEIYYYTAGKYFNMVMNLRGSENYEDFVRYYLILISYAIGSYDSAIDEIDNFMKLSKLEAKYNERANIILGASYYKKGDKKKAEEIWTSILSRNKDNISVLSELINIYAELNVKGSSKLEKIAEDALSGDDRMTRPFYSSLGYLYYNRMNYDRSVQAFELARDKGNKNKLEANDPVFLTRLASSYYMVKKYSESLEIFFDMENVYPVVRQIQDTVQGVYSAEEKGSGDVRIN